MNRMMTLNSFGHKKPRRKLLGRGPSSGLGKTSGRGHKGDGSRSGYKRRFGYEGGGVPLYRRLPTRGFSNVRFATKVAEVTTGRLEKVFGVGESVTLDVLKEKYLVPRTVKKVKIILKGELTKDLIFSDKALVLSSGVKELLGIGGD
ncbi:MAG: 50S ribosomal protein L15 [Victivallaceae bacterium]